MTYVLYLFVGVVHCQVYSCNGYSVLIDYSSVSQTKFLNVYTYFSDAISSSKNYYTIKKENLSLDLIGDFGSVYLDLNSNYVDPKAVDPEVVIYNCKSLKFLMPSLSRFWNSISEMELVITCNYSKDSAVTSKFSFAPKINLIIPILQLEIDNVVSAPIINTLLSSLSSTISINSSTQLVDSKNQIINKVSIKDDILQISSMKSNIQFYLYNYFSMENCDKQDTYLVFNNFLKISKQDYTALNNYFNSMGLTTIEFYKKIKYETEVSGVMRNFEINYMNSKFEEKIVSYFDSYMNTVSYVTSRSFLLLIMILIKF